MEDKVWFVLTDSGSNMIKGKKFFLKYYFISENLLGIRDLQSLHEESREERSKTGDETGYMSGDETADESDEERGEEDLDDHLEATMISHSVALLAYKYTRLPCAAHKVRWDFLETSLYFISLIRFTSLWTNPPAVSLRSSERLSGRPGVLF